MRSTIKTFAFCIISIISLVHATGCVDDAELSGSVEGELSGGFPMSPTYWRAARISTSGGQCSGTVIDPWWVLTARHCLGGNNDPNAITVRLDTQTRYVTHVTLHPKQLEKVDVMLLRLDQPFTNIPGVDELPLWPGDTDDLFGKNALCYGYGGTGTELTGAFFTIASAANAPYYDANKFYLLNASPPGAALVPGDSGSSCMYSGQITGVHKGAGQVSAEAWAAWAEKRRDCPGFDPNHPDTGFCSSACPCDVGEGDCDSNTQCQPGLYCRAAGADYGLPANYSVCDRIDPPSCGTFSTANPNANFCSWSEGEICACTHGEGDCDGDHDCGGSLECQEDSGYAVGLPSTWEICVYPAAPGCPSYHPEVDDTGFCTEACPCDLGQGDCDNDNQCRGGLICKSGVAAQFGKPTSFAMCVRP